MATYYAQSILQVIEENIMSLYSGYHNFVCNGVTYAVHLQVWDGDINWTSNPTVGDTSYDSHMLILLIRGNLSIGSGVTLTPRVRKKGFLVYVTGTLTNRGNISMTARGAWASGQDVWLYRHHNGSLEYVPAVGASGGASQQSNRGANRGDWHQQNGASGSSGRSRRTGGGGSGEAYSYGCITWSGAGGAGTSYSGGSGGGSINGYQISSQFKAEDGSSVGGPGGKGFGQGGNRPGTGWHCCGGAGNPPGWTPGFSDGTHVSPGTGTGGLLIVYAAFLLNYGTMSANGSNGGGNNVGNCGACGGASGGGSINLFWSVSISQGSLTAWGGLANGRYNLQAWESGRGGRGGAGSVTVTQLILRRYLAVSNSKIMYYNFQRNIWQTI